MPYFVYILKCQKDGKYYIGMTQNVNARLEFHNSGRQRSTRNRLPFELVFKQACFVL
ncbi:MAG: GIY-YIG nuclease family protein [Bacteroidota bacterium]